MCIARSAGRSSTRRMRPNPSLERTHTGKPPWPRGARCLSCTSRPRRLTGAVRSAQTLDLTQLPMSLRTVLLVVLPIAVFAGCATRRVSQDVVESWAQRPEEKGRLPVGVVTAVEQVAFRVDRAPTPDASARAVHPAGPAFYAIFDAVRDSGHTYLHTIRLANGTDRKVTLDVAYKIGECLAFRSGLNEEDQWPIRALPGECK